MTREELIKRIQNTPLPPNEKDFHEIVSSFIDSGFITEIEFATGFGICRPTITRWRNNVNRPLPLLRNPVLRFILRRLQRATN